LLNVLLFAVYCNTLGRINDDNEDKFNTDKVEEVVKYLLSFTYSSIYSLFDYLLWCRARSTGAMIVQSFLQ